MAFLALGLFLFEFEKSGGILVMPETLMCEMLQDAKIKVSILINIPRWDKIWTIYQNVDVWKLFSIIFFTTFR